MTYIVIAGKEELSLIPKDSHLPIIITGVGALNIYNALSPLPKDSYIINYGFAGSPTLEKGRTYYINRCGLYHPNVHYQETDFILNSRRTEQTPFHAECLTFCDFVTSSDMKDCVHDMELAFICSMGFASVESYKTVSDKCDYHEYRERVNSLL